MKGQNRVFWLCLTGTILLALGIIFLPRYFSRSLDMSSIGQVEVTGRDGFSFLEAGSNDIPGVARAFRYLEKNGENPILISSLEEPSQIDRELTEKVYYEANSTAKLGMVPWLGIELGDQSANDWKTGLYKDWSECVKFARYYSLTYESLENPNKKEMMNLWYLRFSDDESFDYYFVVNAVTCAIYYAEVYNSYSENMIWTMEEDRQFFYKGEKDITIQSMDSYASRTELGFMFAEAARDYYGAWEYDYIGQTRQYTLNDKLGIAILYFREDEEQELMQNVYIEVKVREEPYLGQYRGLSIGFQDLAGWVRYIQE